VIDFSEFDLSSGHESCDSHSSGEKMKIKDSKKSKIICENDEKHDTTHAIDHKDHKKDSVRVNKKDLLKQTDGRGFNKD